MNKSVVIIGKGPSVLNSTKEFVDSFDEVAICNFPPIDGYEQLIGNRATYRFLNIHDPNPYRKERLNSLGLKYMFNTNDSHDGFPSCFPDHDVLYTKNYRQKIDEEIGPCQSTRLVHQNSLAEKFYNENVKSNYFKDKYGFDPSTGIMAFYFFVTKKEFDTIGLVGFDFFEVDERGYYFPVEQTQKSHFYLYYYKYFFFLINT